MTNYLLGVATPLVAALVFAIIHDIFVHFTSTASAYGCGTCGRWWGPRYDGSRSWLAQARRDWHRATAHPGNLGRLLVARWRGKPVDLDRRMCRAFPRPPVTVWDVLARVPLAHRIAFAIAVRHGRKTPNESEHAERNAAPRTDRADK